MKRTVVLAVCVYVILVSLPGFLAQHISRPGFVADGVGYYAPLASLLIDGDLDLRNEVAHLNRAYLRAAFVTPEGTLGNPFPVGPAVLWSPMVWLVGQLPADARLDAPLPLPQRTQHPAFAPRFARAVQWSNTLWVLLGGGLLVAVLATQFAIWLPALLGAVIVWATPVFYYIVVDPSYGHASSFFAVATLTALALLDQRRRLPLPLLGAAWGLVALMRSQDAVFGLLLAPRLLDSWKACNGWRARIFMVLRFTLPAVLVFTPQMLFWQQIYGRPLLIPPGPDVLPLWKPQLLHLLFSTWNGIVPWAPLLLLGCLGLWWFPDRRWRWFAWGAIALQLYSSSILLDWWGGGSFGPRRLVSLAPLAMVGLCYGLQQLLLRRRSLPVRLGRAGVVLLLIVGMLWPIRIAEYKTLGYIPLNPGDARQYRRHYPANSPAAQPWGHFDYPRAVRELREAGRLLQEDRQRRAGS